MSGTRRVIIPCNQAGSAVASASTACSQWRRPAFTVPNSTALRSTMLRFIVVASTSNCGSTFMIPVRHMIPPLTTLWAAERPTAPEAGALDHDVDVGVEIRGVAGVVVRAEGFDEIALGALGRQVDDVHLIAPLHAQQARQQPDRARAGDQRPAAEEERALRDPVDLVPRLRQHRGRLEQHAQVAQRRGDRQREVRLDAPLLAAVSVAADDPALGEPVVAAHVPLAGGARRARNRIGTAHDPDHQIPGTKARAGRRLEHLAETLVADDQLALARRRLAVFALGDLTVGAAHAHQAARGPAAHRPPRPARGPPRRRRSRAGLAPP